MRHETRYFKAKLSFLSFKSNSIVIKLEKRVFIILCIRKSLKNQRAANIKT